MAGFSTNSWAIANKYLIIDFCRKKAIKLGFERKSDSQDWTDDENKKCLEFLQHVPAREFGMTLLGDKTVINETRLALTPVIDGELFPKSIAQLRAEAVPKPSIVGVTMHEGLLFLALGRKSANNKFLRFCENKVELLLQSHPSTESSDVLTLAAYRELYGINDDLIKNKKLTQRACVDIMSDLINGVGLHRYCVQSAETGTCYRYMFDQFNPSITRAFNLLLPFTGATHGCEIPFIFNVNIFTTPFFKTKADRRVSNLMTQTFANFCKYGNPNGNDPSKPQFNFNWKPVSKSHPDQHLVFTDNVEFKEEPEKNYHAKLMPVLDDLYETLSASSQQ
ncbi:Carboxylic ester hydrolase [Aphelenchoides bicaudatus]|nr:Carboxylic ester hydrolase [Aphelenchoides bicaudatus]